MMPLVVIDIIYSYDDTLCTCSLSFFLQTKQDENGKYYLLKWPIAISVMLSLTHWGRVKHICVSKLTIIGSDNGLLPGRRQAIIWTNAGILLIGPLRTNFSEIFIEIHEFSFNKMHFKMSSGKWEPFCLGLNVLNPGILWMLIGPDQSCRQDDMTVSVSL